MLFNLERFKALILNRPADNNPNSVFAIIKTIFYQLENPSRADPDHLIKAIKRLKTVMRRTCSNFRQWQVQQLCSTRCS